MKKSDMVDKLNIWLSGGIMNYKKEANGLLNFIENAGMLPPTISCDKWIDSGDGQGFTIYQENQWEPEDD